MRSVGPDRSRGVDRMSGGLLTPVPARRCDRFDSPCTSPECVERDVCLTAVVVGGDGYSSHEECDEDDAVADQSGPNGELCWICGEELDEESWTPRTFDEREDLPGPEYDR